MRPAVTLGVLSLAGLAYLPAVTGFVHTFEMAAVVLVVCVFIGALVPNPIAGRRPGGEAGEAQRGAEPA